MQLASCTMPPIFLHWVFSLSSSSRAEDGPRPREAREVRTGTGELWRAGENPEYDIYKLAIDMMRDIHSLKIGWVNE